MKTQKIRPHIVARTVLFGAIFSLSQSVAWSAEPTLGNCHMDACSWSKELSRDFRGSSPRGMLYEVVLLGGSSVHRDGRYDHKAPIKWNAAPHTTYVLCSKTMPLVMGTYDGVFQADFLQIGSGVIGAYQSSLNLYGHVCHNTTITDEQTFARTYDYKPDGEQFEAIAKRLTKPDDTLRLP